MIHQQILSSREKILVIIATMLLILLVAFGYKQVAKGTQTNLLNTQTVEEGAGGE